MSKMLRIQKASGMLLIAVVTLLAGSATPASASVCTLADHIRSANTNTAVGFCPAGTSHDIITITQDITLSEALPAITGTITIEGGGHTISGGGEFRIFDVLGGNLTIKNLTLRDGKAEFGGALRLRGASDVTIFRSTLANNEAVYGGAIAQTGGQQNRLSIENSSFLGNRAERHAGALDIVGGTVSIKNSGFQDNYSDDYGGAIVNAVSTTRIENSTFYNNSAQHDAGVLHVFSGDVSLIHVTMVNNFLTAAYSHSGNTITKQASSPGDAKVSLRNSIVAGRGGEDCFGGVDHYSGNLSRDGSCGFERSGAPRLGDLTGSPAYFPLLDQSPAVDTADPEFCLETDQLGTSRPQGGGCDIGAIESTTAAPAPTPTPTICNLPDQIVAANTDRPYRSCPAGNGADTIYMVRDYELSEPLEEIKTDITIEGNGYTIDGNSRYGIFDVDGGKLTINNVTLTRGSNGGGFGGAISLQNGGTAIANNVSFINNRASDGGAIGSFFPVYIEVNDSHFAGNHAGNQGGAISMNGGGFARIANSSFVDNTSGYDGGAIGSFSGGLAVSNSTFVGNSAIRKGGAFSIDGAGYAENIPVARLTHVTMLDNHARTGMAIWIGRINSKEDITLRMRNSIIAGPDRETLAHCVGRLSQNLYNLIQDGSCSPMLSGDPMFEEAAEDATMVALSAGSPAIDAGHPDVCLEADQIGTPRPLGNGCDLGAIEVMPVVESLSDCRVTPTHNLNFRDGPWGNIIGVASFKTTFVARARTPAWFEVEDEEEGRTGWISALYARIDGDCG